jgi:hypothetical protein
MVRTYRRDLHRGRGCGRVCGGDRLEHLASPEMGPWAYRSSACETPHAVRRSSGDVVDRGPGGVFVVGGVGLQTAVEDADEPVGELP